MAVSASYSDIRYTVVTRQTSEEEQQDLPGLAVTKSNTTANLLPDTR